MLLFICFMSGQIGFAIPKSDKIYELKAGNAIMKISSNGGRILSFKHGNQEFITQPAEHENFGSTLWTAPQSDWGWPPFDVLDNQEYDVEKYADSLKMTSKPDPKSGFQMIKTWKVVGKQHIQIEYRIKNITDKDRSVGPWEVTRVPCGGLAFFPSGECGKVPASDLKPDLQKEGIHWISIDKNPASANRKLFASAKDGWLAYALNGVLFIKQFPDTKPENYAPQQGEVEIYVNKEKSYTELENHGGYQVLKPDESLRYQVNWYLVPIPESTSITIGNQSLIELVNLQITNNPK